MSEKIYGGYIILARKLLDDEIMNKPAIWQAIWMHILLKVSWKGGRRLKRGEGLFNWEVEKDSLSGATKDQWYKAIRWMRASNKVATRKATRGIFITVLNYDIYQNKSLYESQTESHSKASQKPVRSQSKGEEGKEGKKVNKPPTVPLAFDTVQFITAWGEWLEYKKQRREKLTNITIKKQMKQLAGMGEAEAIATIDYSISKGWRGLYQPDKRDLDRMIPSRSQGNAQPKYKFNVNTGEHERVEK